MYIPPIDKDELVRELRAAITSECVSDLALTKVPPGPASGQVPGCICMPCSTLVSVVVPPSYVTVQHNVTGAGSARLQTYWQHFVLDVVLITPVEADLTFWKENALKPRASVAMLLYAILVFWALILLVSSLFVRYLIHACPAPQAVVDDVYLGYISISELLTLLGEALTASGSGSGAAVAAAMAVYRSLVAGEQLS